MVKRTLRLTESVAFELDNLVTENNVIFMRWAVFQILFQKEEAI